MRILYAALLFMMMLVGAPAALAAPQISVGLVTGQFTAELASETDFTAQTVVNGSVRKEFLFKAGSYYFNAANGSVRLVHTDIRDIVQLAEDAELGKLGDAGQEHKAQIRVACLQRTVKLRITLRSTGRFSSSCITSSKGASTRR